jgi:hypothetical protein
MSLLALQRKMAAAVMGPLTPAGNMSSKAPNGRSMRRYAGEFIKPNDRLTSFERLEIYNRQYWYRILDSFIEDFPGLRAVLGDTRFDRLAKAYLTENPSQSFTLRNLCSRLEGWLRKHPKYLGSRRQLGLDMVRLEWADIEAFDGEAKPSLKQEDLAKADPDKLKLHLQPYISLLDLNYPVDDLLLAVKDDEDTDFASNAFNEHRKRKRVAATARLKPKPIYLAVHRSEYSVYFRRLQREEFEVLRGLRRGQSLSRAIDGAFRKSAIPVKERPAYVEEWFHNWSALVWFCRPEQNPAKS